MADRAALRGVAIVRAMLDGGLLGFDPELRHDLEDLFRYVEADDVMLVDDIRADYDRLARELAMERAKLREYRQRVESDRAAGLRVIADLRDRVKFLEAFTLAEAERIGVLSQLLTRIANKEPGAAAELDMAMLDQPENAVAPGSRTGDAVEREEKRRHRRAG